MGRMLFVGGPWHGQVRDIPSAELWRAPSPGAPKDSVTYWCRKARDGVGYFRVMDCTVRNPEKLRDAILIAMQDDGWEPTYIVQ